MSRIGTPHTRLTFRILAKIYQYIYIYISYSLGCILGGNFLAGLLTRIEFDLFKSIPNVRLECVCRSQNWHVYVFFYIRLTFGILSKTTIYIYLGIGEGYVIILHGCFFFQNKYLDIKFCNVDISKVYQKLD